MEIVKNKPLPRPRSDSGAYAAQMCVGDCIVGSKKEILKMAVYLRRHGVKHATRPLVPGPDNDHGNATHGIWKLSVGEK